MVHLGNRKAVIISGIEEVKDEIESVNRDSQNGQKYLKRFFSKGQKDDIEEFQCGNYLTRYTFSRYFPGSNVDRG